MQIYKKILIYTILRGHKNTHCECVLPNSNPQATCKQANSQRENAKIHTHSVYFFSSSASSASSARGVFQFLLFWLLC